MIGNGFVGSFSLETNLLNSDSDSLPGQNDQRVRVTCRSPSAQLVPSGQAAPGSCWRPRITRAGFPFTVSTIGFLLSIALETRSLWFRKKSVSEKYFAQIGMRDHSFRGSCSHLIPE